MASSPAQSLLNDENAFKASLGNLSSTVGTFTSNTIFNLHRFSEPQVKEVGTHTLPCTFYPTARTLGNPELWPWPNVYSRAGSWSWPSLLPWFPLLHCDRAERSTGRTPFSVLHFIVLLGCCIFINIKARSSITSKIMTP